MRRTMWLVVLVSLAVVAAEAPAHAYLDPGTGSVLFQVLVGGVAAVGVIVKLFWHNLSAPFRRRRSTHSDDRE